MNDVMSASVTQRVFIITHQIAMRFFLYIEGLRIALRSKSVERCNNGSTKRETRYTYTVSNLNKRSVNAQLTLHGNETSACFAVAMPRSVAVAIVA